MGCMIGTAKYIAYISDENMEMRVDGSRWERGGFAHVYRKMRWCIS
jgi:hypothetical protein